MHAQMLPSVAVPRGLPGRALSTSHLLRPGLLSGMRLRQEGGAILPCFAVVSASLSYRSCSRPALTGDASVASRLRLPDHRRRESFMIVPIRHRMAVIAGNAEEICQVVAFCHRTRKATSRTLSQNRPTSATSGMSCQYRLSHSNLGLREMGVTRG